MDLECRYSPNKMTILLGMDNRTILPLLSSFLSCLQRSTRTVSSIDQGDLSCLRSIKSSVEDPFGSLKTWSFDNIGDGDNCMLKGVVCWSYYAKKVQAVRLQGLALGQIPSRHQKLHKLEDFGSFQQQFLWTYTIQHQPTDPICNMPRSLLQQILR